ncbi:hypothetical protein [Acinetobacter calcoaceticus]|uniref:hypothetical protein n=1 Tax=Acinetobacter calcoaceticus TaxID=471 RepID=UPI0018DB79FC|nr:hypothetical protein [Acinetobacter calcoaceticus]
MSDFEKWYVVTYFTVHGLVPPANLFNKYEDTYIHSDVYRHNLVWQLQQAKIDEKDKMLIDQGQRFNEQAQNVKDLEYENYQLQKRLDQSLKELAGATRWIQEDAIDDVEFLKGGVLAAFRRLDQTLKVGHSIYFQAGDKVVFDSRIVSDDVITIDEILDDGVKIRGNFFHARYLTQMRHATSEEIAVGHRIMILSRED